MSVIRDYLTGYLLNLNIRKEVQRTFEDQVSQRTGGELADVVKQTLRNQPQKKK